MADAPLARRLGELALDLAPRPRGLVVEVGDGVAVVRGLDDAGYEDLVAFDSGALGMVLDLSPEHAGVVLLGGAEKVGAGQGARALGHPPDVVVGPSLLGRVIDPLGRALDGGPDPRGPRLGVFREAPSILERTAVRTPLLTGITAIDSAVPIGRGQRQLLVGDHDTGKTALALDIVAAQAGRDLPCVFVAVGGPMSRVLAIRESLASVGALANTTIVAADAASPAGLQVLAPQAGTAIAESFRDEGRDVLVVYDDLTKHADAWRELALLLGRPPGREAFPGDIFHVHAALLERAAALARGGSITAIPLAETVEGDLSAYIPTNLISITDGQVVLDAVRFERNERPAVDVGMSVSRIGGAAQAPVMRDAARDLRIVLSRAEELEALTRVGMEVDPETARSLRRGRTLRALLRQGRLAPRGQDEEVLLLRAVSSGALDGVAPEDAPDRFERAYARHREVAPQDLAALREGRAPGDGWEARWRATIEEVS